MLADVSLFLLSAVKLAAGSKGDKTLAFFVAGAVVVVKNAVLVNYARLVGKEVLPFKLGLDKGLALPFGEML